MTKIININRDKLTPEQLLNELLSEKDNLESVVVIYKGKDGSMDIGYSHQSLENLVFTNKFLDAYVTHVMTGQITPGENE
jgi:hypothetical protein